MGIPYNCAMSSFRLTAALPVGFASRAAVRAPRTSAATVIPAFAAIIIRRGAEVT